MRLPRLQLHLSTCIVLMFVAGGIMWLNLDDSIVPFREASYADLLWGGWPWYWRMTDRQVRVVFADSLIQAIRAALPIIDAVAFVCEWYFSPREGETSAPQEKPSPQSPQKTQS